jgi:hypothetical protein
MGMRHTPSDNARSDGDEHVLGKPEAEHQTQITIERVLLVVLAVLALWWFIGTPDSKPGLKVETPSCQSQNCQTGAYQTDTDLVNVSRGLPGRP